MSGIAGVVHLEGAAVDPGLLEKMAAALAFRGPDASHTWSDAGAALCHAWLRTSPEKVAESETQPCTLDNQVWIAADARIDDRETLLAKLRPHAPQELRSASSAHLILHAYARWGVDCVEQLLGDFAFILWDRPRRRVFCARDHLGVKPLCYCQVGKYLLVGSTVDCLRQIPLVPADVNDQAVADFLLFGMNREADTTFFSAIRRLPAAHRLVASAGELRVERFWTLPVEEPLYLRKSGEYIERFWELFHASLRDRLAGGTLGISMSGGIDSSALAAASVELGASAVAFTAASGASDSEGTYARSVATRLGIPIYLRDIKEEQKEWPPGGSFARTSEPSANVLDISSGWPWSSGPQPRVIFYGEGPDNALTYEWRPYLAYLRRRGEWGRMAFDVANHIAAHRRIPLLSALPRVLREKMEPFPEMPFPVWLNAELISRLQLRKRWEAFQQSAPAVHPVRPQSDGSFRDVLWAVLLEGIDNMAAPLSTEFRYPFLDLRLLRFFLAVPAMPWCRRKHLLRRALRGKIPDGVLRRPKTPLQRTSRAQHRREMGLPPLAPPPLLSRYLDWSQVSTASSNSAEYEINMRAIGLHYWLLTV